MQTHNINTEASDKLKILITKDNVEQGHQAGDNRMQRRRTQGNPNDVIQWFPCKNTQRISFQKINKQQTNKKKKEPVARPHKERQLVSQPALYV